MTSSLGNILEYAKTLYGTIMAWQLHKETDYDAYQYNFKVKIPADAFTTNPQKRSRNAQACIQYAMWLCRRVEMDNLIPFVLINDIDFQNMTTKRQEKVDALNEWLLREGNELLSFGPPYGLDGFDEERGLHKFLLAIIHRQMSLPRAAKIAHDNNMWDAIYSTKDKSNFLFDIWWPRLHRLRGLYEMRQNK